jgi:hypothetical protein
MAKVRWIFVDEGWYSSTIGSIHRRILRSDTEYFTACSAKRERKRGWFAEPQGVEPAGPFRTSAVAKAYVEEHGRALRALPESVRLHTVPGPDFRPVYPFPLRRPAMVGSAA